MKRKLIALGIAAVTVAAASTLAMQPASAATVGLHISGRNIVEANGQTFIMRGVSHAHVWFSNQTSTFANVKALGANTVRVVLGSGKRWGPSTDVANVISLCKQSKLICVLEVHDTTGYGEEGAAASLDEAVNYWISQKSALVGQENYISINIGNEPIGNTNPAQWMDATSNAIKKMRTNGFQHLLMVDAPNWGQDWSNTMRDNAQTVLDADSQHNTVLSIHMYDVYSSAQTIIDYLNVFQTKGWPLVVGEFGWKANSSNVDDQTIMSEAVARGIGYIGWSWSGNNDPILDMVPVSTWDPAQLTTWGQRIFNGANGIKATAKEASIYSGTTPTTGPVTTPPTVPPTTTPTTPPTTRPTTPPTTTPTGAGCTAAYSVVGQWQGGFQAEVRVTAGSSAINGWTVTWTYGNGQAVTQAWNATVSSSGSGVTARNVSYNGRLAAGGSTNFGFLGSWNGTNSVPAVSCSAS